MSQVLEVLVKVVVASGDATAEEVAVQISNDLDCLSATVVSESVRDADEIEEEMIGDDVDFEDLGYTDEDDG